jgi:transcriptional regulator with AAA-type ATPase domain
MLYDELERRELKKQVLSKQMINQIMEYTWPGNIKELRNTIKKSVIRLSNDEELTLNIDNINNNNQVKSNVFMFKLLKSLVEHSDKSVHYQAHNESLSYFIKNKKIG